MVLLETIHNVLYRFFICAYVHFVLQVCVCVYILYYAVYFVYFKCTVWSMHQRLSQTTTLQCFGGVTIKVI